MMRREAKRIGNWLAPPRFLIFLSVLVIATPVMLSLFGQDKGQLALLAAFDMAALAFLVGIAPLLKQGSAATMRAHAAANDANRLLVLILNLVMAAAILAIIGSLLGLDGARESRTIALVIVSLAAAWFFANTVFALHYAHLYYLPVAEGDARGLDFPGDDTPDYGDFLYFSFTLGMTFQTSDVTVTGRHMRRIVLMHSIAAFIFNIGILAFVINTLGGAH